MFKKIGIIGGSGKMGNMFAHIFTNYGFECLISDEKNLLTEKRIISECDLVIISVPISVVTEVIDRVGPQLNAQQVLVDFTSVKSSSVPKMQKYKAEVIPAHPMFGPTKRLNGQSLILISEQETPNLKNLQELFTKIGLQVYLLKTWLEHDKLMSYIQGLIHFMHIVFTKVLQKSGINLDSLMELASPVYRANFAFACRIITRDSGLYSRILIDNDNNQSVLEEFVAQASVILNKIKSKDETSLSSDFVSLNDYLGDYAQDFSKESDYLIDQMSAYQKIYKDQ